MKLSLRKKIAAFAFGLIVMTLPVVTSIAASSSKIVTVAAIYSENNHVQAAAAVIDTGVGVAAMLGWLCGIQGAIMTLYAG
jgi:hypothetical protein